ncbi:MAG: hypothetical protein FWG51_06125, partial [Firmicutes bacterium]|nr:hypothetical protein [Bacillota bacterium]
MTGVFPPSKGTGKNNKQEVLIKEISSKLITAGNTQISKKAVGVKRGVYVFKSHCGPDPQEKSGLFT